MSIRITVERVCENNEQIILDRAEKYVSIVPNHVQPGHVANIVTETVERIQEQS